MSSHIQKSCVGLEATLSDGKRKYIDKVNALFAAWEHVTNYIANTPETTQSLIEWANEHTLELVLRGEWPKLAPATKTHLNVTLQRCSSQLTKQQQHQAARRCQSLIELVQNPWGKPALDRILNNQLNPDHEEEEFCCQEKGELLKMRLKILCEDRCEDIAVNLAAACVRSLRRNDRLRSLSEPGQVHYMVDVYIVLLYKLKRTHDIVAQLKLMDLKDGLEMMQRLSGEKPTKYGTARVWRNSSKAAELVAQYLVTTGMVRPLAEVGPATLEQILNSWALLHAKSKDVVATLPGIIRKLIEPAESAQHIYIFCAVLARHFGDVIKPLVVELYIRALTTDMNELENQKSKSNKEKVVETAQRLSQEFLKLADCVSDSVSIARECVLTAFSLHPTRACYDRIRDLAVACGKIQAEVKLEKEELPEEETTLTLEETLTEETAAVVKNSSDENVTKTTTTTTTTAISQEGLDVEGERTKDEVSVVNEGSRTKDDSASPSCATDDKSKCHSQEDTVPVKCEESSSEKVPAPTEPVDKVKEIKKECEEETTRTSTPNAEANQGALILIKGDAVTGSANYDERAVPNQVLDGERLGISAQLCDDLAVVLSSQRYHVLTWWLDWKELSELCERYLENAEEMRNTNKELKYLNIDYSQFKDQPYEDDRDSMFYGIEKGYEQWDDSDFSESDMLHQSTDVKRETSNTRRSLDESSDTDSENVVRKRGRPRKVPRLESSGSEYDIRHRKPRQRFRKVLRSSSESDTNTQDSQTDSLGSDGFKKDSKKIPKRPCNGTKKVTKRRPRKTKLTVDSVSHFQMLVNENIRPSGVDGVSDNSNSDIMTLFSADMDENKRETIKGSAAFNAAQLIISEKRSDPEVIKSLRMFRPNSKKLVQINEKISEGGVVVVKTNNNNNNNINNGVSKKKENNKPGENTGNNKPTKFAPMLSTLNLNPKIALRRVDEIDKKLNIQQKKQQAVIAGDLSNEIRNIQKTITFTTGKNPLTGFQKQRALVRKPGQRKSPSSKSIKTNLTKSKLQELLTKSVPGMGSMEFSVPPRVRPTVQVVQVTRNISQSPNSTASGNTPPRSRSTIQLPGTPSSGGHDSGVGMSPAGQTPPPPTRSSSLQDVGEEANQPPDTSPGLVESTNISTMDSNDGPRTVALAVLANQRITSNQSPKKSPSPSTNNTGEQQLVLCKPDGTYQLVSPSIVTGQRGILSLQNFEDANIGFARQVPIASVTTADTKTSQPQTSRNTGLPKFQQAFGKTICTLSTESTTVPSSSTADETPAAPAGAATNVQRAKLVAASNISKAVQTAGQNTSIANIPNLQVATGTTRQILNIVQSSANASGANATGQTLQLSGAPGVIYAHKIPGAAPGTQLISIPANLASNRQNVQVKLNIIRTPFRSTGGGPAAIQVLTSRLPQQQSQQQQQQQQQPQTVRQADPLINSTMEMPNQVSSSTLEQLREFESVLEQVKERSTSSNQSSSADATTTPQTQTQAAQSSTTTVKQTQQQQPAQQVAVNSLAQQLLMSSPSPSSTVEFSNNGTATVSFQQQQQQQEVTYPQKVAVMYANQNNGSATPKVVNSSTPVVVVTSYCQPAASPALSVTSQSSSSPCVTPAPTPISSTGKTQPQSAPKSAKKTAPKAVKQQVNTQSAAKTTPIPKPQQKPQEDPETTQRIYAILGQYAEQLRNSPDLNNKPAPRRRSNPPTNPNQSSKRKKSNSGKSKTPSGQQTSEPSPSAEDMGRTMGSSEDSSGGGGIGTSSSTGNGGSMMHVQDSPSGFSVSEETLNNSNNNSQSAANDNATLGNATETRTASATSDSNDSVETNVKRRNLIFAEPNTGQPRTVIVQEALQPTSVSEALAGKMTTGTAVLVSGTNFMLPMNFVKSGQQITVVSGGSKLLAAVPAVRTSGGAAGAVSNAFVLQSLLSQANKVIQQQHQQPKQVKLTQQSQIVIPQSAGSVVRFASEDNGDNIKAAADIKAETTTTTIATSKPAALGLFQHSGVITSNPNLSQRLFNSSSVKLPCAVKSETSAEKVATATAVSTTTATAMTLAFSSSSSSCTVNDNDVVGQTPKEPKEAEAMAGHVEDEKLMISPKAIKRKDAETLGIVADALVQCNARAEATPQPPNRAKPKVTTSPVSVLIPTTTTTASSSLDTTTQYLVSGGPSSGSDSQESAASSSTIQNSAIESSSLDGTVKVENGVLCGNARLQEAWEPERKGSPDTPWRYIPTTNALGMEPLKVYSRDAENSETIHNSVLQIINKGQGIEMSSSGVFQTKKYYHTMNNSIDAFPKFPGGNKSLASKASAPPNNARAQAEQENQQRLNERKQQMLERELRLQKSLSEECEDLGVDEPSTSDLFPEADLLFDTNHSPSFDHSSQEASCSQSLSGPTTLSSIKSYSGTGSFFKSLDSVSSDSRDTSPVVMTTAVVPPPEPTTTTTTTTTTTKKKAPVQRRAAKPKESQAKKNKKSMDSMQLSDGICATKHLRLSLVGNLSQDEASNSNSDLSRLSPMENDSLKETSNQKTTSRNGSKDREGTPSSSRSSFQSHVKLELDADSSSATTANTIASSNVIVAPTVLGHRDGSGVVVVANNISSTASSAEEDENLTLLDDATTSVRIASPLSPIAGPLLMTHRYTYANNKKRPTTVKQSRTTDFFSVDTRANPMSWESPMSERTRSSSDDDADDDEVVDGDESSISETLSTSQLDNTETSNIGNGLQDVLRSVASVKVTPVDHATYSAKRKTAVNRKTTTNHKDSTGLLNKSHDGKSGAAKKSKAAAAAATLSLTASETESSSPAPSADKLFDMVNPSDDESIMGGSSSTLVEATISTTPTAAATAEHCTTSSSSSSSAARRSSLRGHVKKGCACCNGSPERPAKMKKAPPVKPNQQQQEQHQQQHPQQQQQSTAVVNSKVKKTTVKQQQAKQLAKKR